MKSSSRKLHAAINANYHALFLRVALVLSVLDLMQKKSIVAAGILLGLANTSMAQPPSNSTPVVTQSVSFRGWSNCTLISNGIVEAVVVPQIGRIMAFHFVGDPQSDPLYVNPDCVGKTAASASGGGGNWANFGGDKLWPSEQANWPEYIGHTWPPDPAFDGEPQQLADIPNGVTLTTPASVPFGAVAVRTITLRPGEARLYISQVLSRTAPPAPVAGAAALKDGSFAPIGIWSVTQTRADATLFVPLSRSSNFPSGVVTFDSNSNPVDQAGPMPTGWTIRPSMLIGRMDPVNSHKLGTDSRSGWIASMYGDNVVFSEHYKDQPHATFPDRGCRNEVYVGSGSNPYFEFEILGPLNSLNAGQQVSYDVYWQLDRLKKAPKDDTDAAAAIRKIMKQKKAGL